MVKIAVVGDSIADIYYDVDVTRISPEYPIPVYKLNRENGRFVLGGAANVAKQIGKFGLDVTLFSACKYDYLSDAEKCGVKTNCFIPCEMASTKHRYYSDSIPLVRIDEETGKTWEPINELDAIRKFSEEEYDVVVFSDYHKGFFLNRDKWLEAAADALTIVDSKYDQEKWVGCDIYKPNLDTALGVTGRDNVLDAIESLVSDFGFNSVIVTEGGLGATFYNNDDGLIHQYRRNDDIDDPNVIGAGDSFAAALAIYRSLPSDSVNGDIIDFAIDLSRKFVEKGRLVEPIDLLEDKIVPNHLWHYLRSSRKVVFTNGCFDLLHEGHIKLLEEAKSRGDILVVGVNSDSSVKALKGPSRPVVKDSSRSKIVASLACVDYVCVFEEETPRNLIETIKPSLIVKDSDYEGKYVAGSETCPVEYITRQNEWSTTGIIEKISK